MFKTPFITVLSLGFLCMVSGVFAAPSPSVLLADTNNTSNVSFSGITDEQLNKTVTLNDFFIIYFNAFATDIPDSYQYTNILYTNVPQNSQVYDALQKGIYLNLIHNLPVSLRLDSLVSQADLAQIVRADFGENIAYTPNTPLTYRTLLYTVIQLRNEIENDTSSQPTENTGSSNSNVPTIESSEEFPILDDIYTKLLYSHYYSGQKFTERDLMEGAMSGMVNATGDKFTNYFPPVEAQSFNEQLTGQFEGIGAYLDAPAP